MRVLIFGSGARRLMSYHEVDYVRSRRREEKDRESVNALKQGQCACIVE